MAAGAERRVSTSSSASAPFHATHAGSANDLMTHNNTAFMFNTTTGDLYFDPDGTGPVAAVLIAQLANLASPLASSDFIIV